MGLRLSKTACLHQISNTPNDETQDQCDCHDDEAKNRRGEEMLVNTGANDDSIGIVVEKVTAVGESCTPPYSTMMTASVIDRSYKGSSRGSLNRYTNGSLDR